MCSCSAATERDCSVALAESFASRASTIGTPSPSAVVSSAGFAPPTTTTCVQPASCSRSQIRRTMGTPATGCRTVGVADCIDVASSGASTRAVHPARDATAVVFGAERGDAPGVRLVMRMSAVPRSGCWIWSAGRSGTV